MGIVLLVVMQARAQKNSARNPCAVVRIYARAVLVCRGERLLIESNIELAHLQNWYASLNPLSNKCHIEVRT